MLLPQKQSRKSNNSSKRKRKKLATDGKDMLRRKLRNIGAAFLSINITELEKHYNMDSAIEMYYQIAKREN